MPKLKATQPKPKPVPKPGLLVDEALSSASTTPGTLPNPMASAPERPEGPVTYSVRTFGQMDRECGYVNSRGDRVPRRRINQDGDLEVYRQDGLVEVSRRPELTNKRMKMKSRQMTMRKSRKVTMKTRRMTNLETEILLVVVVLLLVETLRVMVVELQVIKALLEVIPTLRQRLLRRLAMLVAVGCWTEHSLCWPTFAAAMGIFNRKKKH